MIKSDPKLGFYAARFGAIRNDCNRSNEKLRLSPKCERCPCSGGILPHHLYKLLTHKGKPLLTRRVAGAIIVAYSLLWLLVENAFAQASTVHVAYLRAAEEKNTISLLDKPAPNDGLAGAELATDDNATTGRFLNQPFALEDVTLKPGDDPAAAAAALADKGVFLVIAELPADQLLKAADAGRARGQLFFNAAATDDRLREEDCRANVIHVAPTRSMLADGLAQYLVWKRWRKWFFVGGSHERDKLWGDALKRSAKRFGAKIVEERTFQDAGGARQTDTGIALIQRQIPAFTQGAADHDVLVAADESEVFAAYLPYRTYDPRPVAGSAGLRPASWDPSMEQWGATQLQNRFMKKFSRRMTALDLQAWTAGRMIGEAATRTRAAEAQAIRAYLTGPDFSVSAYKGQRLTLRPWNLQLRQPILLSDGRNVTSVSPQEGFLHQVSELDTLGYDQPETKCQLK
jgi:ABC transporter substrate binding protein (PQQ-dependent alcohol dehydrogenase system)